jgi:hypothetical protein
LLGTSGNKALLINRGSDSQLLSQPFIAKVWISREDWHDLLTVRLISESISGVDKELSFSLNIPPGLAPRVPPSLSQQPPPPALLECRHTCSNKSTCGHSCCKKGVDHGPRSNFRVRDSIEQMRSVFKNKFQHQPTGGDRPCQIEAVSDMFPLDHSFTEEV